MGNFPNNLCICGQQNIIFQKSFVVNVDQNEDNKKKNLNFNVINNNNNNNFNNKEKSNNNNNNNMNNHDMFYFSKIENMTLTPIIQYLDTEIIKQKLTLIGENHLSQTYILNNKNNNDFKRIQTIKYKSRKDLFDELIKKSKSMKQNDNFDINILEESKEDEKLTENENNDFIKKQSKKLSFNIQAQNNNDKNNNNNNINQTLPINEHSNLMQINKEVCKTKTIENSHLLKYTLTYSAKEIPSNEEEFLLRNLYKNFLFMNYSKTFLKKIIDSLTIFVIEDKTTIFKKGEIGNCFFIIKSGKCEVKLNEKLIKIIGKGETFGDLSLLNHDCVRKYDVVANGKIELYAIDFLTFNFLLKEHENILFENNVDFSESEIKNKFKFLIEDFYLFKTLKKNEIENIFLFSKIFCFDESNFCLNSNEFQNVTKFNNNNKKNNNFNKKPFFYSNKNIFFVIEGEICCFFLDREIKINVKKNEFFGVKNIIFEKNKKIEIKTISNKTILMVVNYKSLIECLGPNYNYKLLFKMFFNECLKLNVFNYFIFDCQKNKTKENFKLLFKSFTIKKYKKNEIILNKNDYNQYNNKNKKLIFLLLGEVINADSNQKIMNLGQIFGEDYILNNKE